MKTLQECKLIELNSSELKKINGGNELTDAIWSFIGMCVGNNANVHASGYGTIYSGMMP